MITLGDTALKWEQEVEYLGLRLNRHGFSGKVPAVVEEKTRSAAHMLLSEVCYNLNL